MDIFHETGDLEKQWIWQLLLVDLYTDLVLIRNELTLSVSAFCVFVTVISSWAWWNCLFFVEVIWVSCIFLYQFLFYCSNFYTNPPSYFLFISPFFHKIIIESFFIIPGFRSCLLSVIIAYTNCILYASWVHFCHHRGRLVVSIPSMGLEWLK